MTITTEQKLVNFEFWSGGKDNANKLTYEQLDQLEDILIDIYPNGLDETDLNDLMWFDFELVCEWLCIKEDEEE